MFYRRSGDDEAMMYFSSHCTAECTGKVLEQGEFHCSDRPAVELKQFAQ